MTLSERDGKLDHWPGRRALQYVRRRLADIERNSNTVSRFANNFATPREPDPAIAKASLVIWCTGAIMLFFVLIWTLFSSFHIDRLKIGWLIVLCALVAALSARIRNSIKIQAPALLIEGFAQFSFISLVAVLASYEIGSAGVPYRDTALASVDSWLGLDWVTASRFVANHPWIASLLRFGYKSFTWQPVIVICFLAISGSEKRLQQFMLAWVFALVITLGGLAIAPCQTAWVHFGGLTSVPDLAKQVGNGQFEALEALRSGGLRDLLDDSSLLGLVSFPSFHTTGAMLYIFALWGCSSLRWPTVALNVTLILATPVIGAHYFIDLAGGAAVAAAALALASLVMTNLATGRLPVSAPKTASTHYSPQFLDLVRGAGRDSREDVGLIVDATEDDAISRN